MMTKRSDLSERGLEIHATELLVAQNWNEVPQANFDPGYCLFLGELIDFITATQPKIAIELDLQVDSPTRHKALSRIQDEISRRGIIDVFRNGIKHNQHDITLFYGAPTSSNDSAIEKYLGNRFSVTRQLHYSPTETALSLDLVLHVNGIPVFNF
jgi:type I restriction enzyme R subunit